MNALPDWIYFIVADEVGRVKIGASTDPDRRARMLKSASPVKINLAVKARGNEWMESRLHAYFSDEWSHGEWFRLSPRIAALIEQLKAGRSVESCVELPTQPHRVRLYGKSYDQRRKPLTSATITRGAKPAPESCSA